ncbi:MAG: hypothetical protein ABFC57_17555 [Veillonellales bacterium]
MMPFASETNPWKNKKLWVGVAGVFVFLGVLFLLRYLNFFNGSYSLHVQGTEPAVSVKSKNGGKVVKPFIPQADEPIQTGYIADFSPRQTTGHGTILLDNTQNGFHVKVAIYYLHETGEELVRACSIRRGEQFVIYDLDPGKYDVRFRNLNTGKCFRAGSAVSLGEKVVGKEAAGDQISVKLFSSSARSPVITPIVLDEFEPPNVEL